MRPAARAAICRAEIDRRLGRRGGSNRQLEIHGTDPYTFAATLALARARTYNAAHFRSMNARNPVGWFEIYVQDMTRARAFYESVFEVKLQELPSPVIRMFAFPMQPEQPGCSGALVHYSGKDSGGRGTIVYFSCADCGVQAKRAAANGGRIFKEKFSIGPYGYIALVFDTEENMIGLHSQA